MPIGQLRISCAFATTLQTPDHIAHAEQLGYQRAWCYDSPAVLPDVWMILGLAASRTTTIGIGPGVLIPSLRHPMVTAAAIATLDSLAPGRVAVAVGSGFTGRVALGERPMRWADVEEYLVVLRGLLRGEITATASANELRRRLESWAEAGVSEVVYQPGGRDIAHQLESFAHLALS